MPFYLWLWQKGPSTDFASSPCRVAGVGTARRAVRAPALQCRRAQERRGRGNAIPCQPKSMVKRPWFAGGGFATDIGGWPRHATVALPCGGAGRRGSSAGRTLPTPACRGPFKYSAVSPCFQGIHGAKIGAPPSPPVGHLCLSERAWNGRMPSASEAASRPSAQDIRFYASFADAVERWEPENFYCKTDARERVVPSRRAPSAVLQGFSGPPANAAGSALFSAPERFSFATGPGEGSVARGQTKRRDDAGAGRPAAAVTMCAKIDQYAQK